MINAPLRDLFTLTIVSSSAIIVMLLLRRYLRQAFGPAVSYLAWLLVPAVIVAALLPKTRASELPFAFSMEVSKASALAVAYGSHAALSIDGSAWLLGAWGIGSALFLLYLAGLQYAFLRNLGTLSPSRGMLRAASCVGCPALVGIFRPKVILPAAATGTPPIHSRKELKCSNSPLPAPCVDTSVVCWLRSHLCWGDVWRGLRNPQPRPLQSFSVAGLKLESQGKGRKFEILGSPVSIAPSGH